jgi:hypothetical protein
MEQFSDLRAADLHVLSGFDLNMGTRTLSLICKSFNPTERNYVLTIHEWKNVSLNHFEDEEDIEEDFETDIIGVDIDRSDILTITITTSVLEISATCKSYSLQELT